MSSLNGFEDAGAWGVSEDITSGDTVKTAVKKDQVIKCGIISILSLTKLTLRIGISLPHRTTYEVGLNAC